MKSLKALTAAAMVLALTACIDTRTGAQRQAEAIGQAFATLGAERTACAQAVYDSADYAPLRPRFYRPPSSDMPLSTLTDNAHITPQERAAFLAAHPRSSACSEAAENALYRISPGLAAIVRRGRTRGEDEKLKLLDGRLSWAQYATRLRDIHEQQQTEWANEVKVLDSNLAQQNAEEMRARASLAEAWLLTHPYQPPAPMPLPPPPQPSHQITCTTLGNTTTCN